MVVGFGWSNYSTLKYSIHDSIQEFRDVYMVNFFKKAGENSYLFFQEAELNHPELLNLPDEIESCEKAAG